MYGKVKLNKRQIKEDKFTTFMLSTKQQVTDSWQYYVIGFVVIILVISAIVFFQDMQKTQSSDAANLYAKGIVEFRQSNYQNAVLNLQQVLDDYAGTESVELATYMLGKTNLRLRNYPEAIRFFEMYISKYSDDKLKTAASLAGIATAIENQGQLAEAAAKFAEATEAFPDGPLAADYHFSAMRDYLETGDIASAEIHFKSITENFPGSSLVARSTLLFAEKSKR